MTKVSCRQKRCVSWSAGRCSAEEILIDREGLCLTQDEEDIEVDDLSDPVEVWDAEEVDDTFDEEDEDDWEDEEDWPEEEDEDLEEEDEDWADDDWAGDKWQVPKPPRP
jgi:hypothetical protein